MRKSFLLILIVTLIIINTVYAFASSPEIATDFSLITDYREDGDSETITNRQWKYMSNTNLVTENDGTYSNYGGYVDLPWNSAGYWKTTNADARVCKNGVIYSAKQVRVSVVWIAPMTGSVKVITEAGTFGRQQGITEERDDDAEIVTRIVKTDSLGQNQVELSQVILEAENSFKYTTNTALHPTLSLEVSKGDKIFFESWGTGNVLREIKWDPKIEYDAAVLYHDADGNIISSETAIETHETINCSLYSREEFEDNTLLCLTLFDSKQRLAAINLDTVTPISNFYTLNLTVPEFIGEVEPDEVSYSKWSINITAVDGDNNYKPIMVNDSLVFN